MILIKEVIERSAEKGKIKHINIYLTRADSAYLDLEITDNDDNPVLLGDGDLVKIQVRESEADDAKLVFEGTIIYNGDGTATWRIYPSDTAGKDITDYVWDAEVEYSNGDTFTFIPLSVFGLLPESTRREEV